MKTFPTQPPIDLDARVAISIHPKDAESMVMALFQRAKEKLKGAVKAHTRGDRTHDEAIAASIARSIRVYNAVTMAGVYIRIPQEAMDAFNATLTKEFPNFAELAGVGPFKEPFHDRS